MAKIIALNIQYCMMPQWAFVNSTLSSPLELPFLVRMACLLCHIFTPSSRLLRNISHRHNCHVSWEITVHSFCSIFLNSKPKTKQQQPTPPPSTPFMCPFLSEIWSWRNDDSVPRKFKYSKLDFRQRGRRKTMNIGSTHRVRERNGPPGEK